VGLEVEKKLEIPGDSAVFDEVAIATSPPAERDFE
jgi:hypothetical protein